MTNNEYNTLQLIARRWANHVGASDWERDEITQYAAIDVMQRKRQGKGIVLQYAFAYATKTFFSRRFHVVNKRLHFTNNKIKKGDNVSDVVFEEAHSGMETPDLDRALEVTEALSDVEKRYGKQYKAIFIAMLEGNSQSEIGRQLGVTRQYVYDCQKKIETFLTS